MRKQIKMNHDNNEGHFFASSIANWATTTPKRTLGDVIKYMEKEGYPFSLFYVPAPWDSDYEIRRYQPQVEGTTYLGTFSEGESK